jgi:hypothetical protein
MMISDIFVLSQMANKLPNASKVAPLDPEIKNMEEAVNAMIISSCNRLPWCCETKRTSSRGRINPLYLSTESSRPLRIMSLLTKTTLTKRNAKINTAMWRVDIFRLSIAQWQTAAGTTK